MARKSKKSLARARAALKGWATRRKQARLRARAAKKGWQTRKAIPARKQGRPRATNVDFLVTISIKYKGERPRKRDLLIPAPPGSSFSDLKKIANEYLPPEARPLLKMMKKTNTTIAEGPPTRAKKTRTR